ncbi:hypothetical protein KQI84_15245 [bacterium]|nr:hypothetical protein [bacterium]
MSEILPITEWGNELTEDLDISEPLGIARILRQVDEQLFTGWQSYDALLDTPVIERAAQIAHNAALAMRAGEDGAILIAGAGTSGRLASLVCRQFNRLLRASHLPEVFRPLVAGGPLALVRAQEGAEDDPTAAVEDLQKAIPESSKQVLYVGITCGFSAAYVAGQMDALKADSRANIVLLGFNPIHQARDMKVEGWDKTFAGVVRELTKEGDRFDILNPVYGPEAVMGSTRMKGGSATKMLLEAIFYTALEMAGHGAPEAKAGSAKMDEPASARRRIRELLRRYRSAIQAIYEKTDVLAEMIKLAGAALRSGGQISYIGRDTAGIVAMIDAAECPPTFGAGYDDLRGYIRSGWPELLDEERDLASSGSGYAIDHETFEKSKLPDLAKGDLVLGVAVGEIGPNTRRLLEEAQKTKATVGVITVCTVPPKSGDLPEGLENIFILEVPSLGFQPGFFNEAELGLKIALNAMSTGAHVLTGKVFHNQMIDLRISNTKLYLRAIETIQTITGAEKDDARRALHRAIFKTDSLTTEEDEAPPSAIIKAAGERLRIVPMAILLATGQQTYESAGELLAQDPVVRRVIESQIEEDSE